MDAAAIHEQSVSATEPGLSPAERVQEAVACIPAHLELEPTLGFRRWTVRDFHRAYSSGQTTPVMVNNPFFSVFFPPAGMVVKQNVAAQLAFPFHASLSRSCRLD